MICEQLSSLLGFQCTALADGGKVALVSTPFTFDDGDAIPVFVEQVAGQVRFFDDGQTLMHFLGRGLAIENKKHASFLINTTAKNGTTFTDRGEIEVWAPVDQASFAFSKYLTSLMALSAWEREQQGSNTDLTLFVEEVAMALRAWKPESKLELDPAFEGISGKGYKLDFKLDGQPVAVTGPHPNAVSALLHKLVDIHAKVANHDSRFLIVIDDRNDPEGARKEALIVQAIATVMPFTALEHKSRSSENLH